MQEMLHLNLAFLAANVTSWALIYISLSKIFRNTGFDSALKDHEKSYLDLDQDHLPKFDLRSRSDPDLT